MADALPVLYSFRRCPYAMRARLALAASGVRVLVREVVLKDKPEALLTLSPKATVPVLHLPDGRVIDESLDIMFWALAQHDPGHWLVPDHDQMRALIAINDGPFKQHLDRYKYPVRYEGVDAVEHREQALACLLPLDTKLRETPFLFGRKPALADAAIFPFVRQFAATDAGWFDTQRLDGLHRWRLEWMKSSLFKAVMARWSQWKPGDAEPVFPGNGAVDWF